MKTATLRIAALLTVLLVSGVALADEAEEEARLHFEQGVLLYDDGRFDQAAAAFERAYQLKPSHKLLYNIGQVESELGHFAAAYGAYRRYLAEGGEEVDTERRQEVGDELKRLRILVASIEVQCPIDGAKVTVDEVKVGTTPLAEPVLVDLGEHEVVVRKGSNELYRERLRLGGGEAAKIDVPGIAPGSAPAEPVPPQNQEQDEGGGDRLWTWVALGVGGAAGIAGGILGGVTLSQKAALLEGCDDEVCAPKDEEERDSIRSMALAADVLYGVAAVGIAAGIVLFFVEPGLEESDTVAVRPQLSGEGAGLSIEGRFSL